MSETIEDIIDDITTGDVTEVIDDTASGDDTTTTEETAETVTQPEELNIPENWEAPVKDFFNSDVFKDNFAAKKTFFDKFKSMDDGYQGKYQSLAEQRKAFETERKSFEDNRNLVSNYKALEEQARGIDGDLYNREVARLGGTNQYLLSLHQVNAMMSKDPLGTMQNMCNAYGITPEMLANGRQDPSYQMRQSQVSTQKSMEKMREEVLKQVRDEMLTSEATRKAEALFVARDESGNLRYPHLNEIQDDVAMLIETKGCDVDKAYQLAKIMNPEVFKDEMIKQAEQKAKAEEMERAKVIKSPVASPKSIHTTDKNLTIDDITAEIMRENGMEV